MCTSHRCASCNRSFCLACSRGMWCSQVVDAEELRPVGTMQQPVLIAVAVWFGDVRLIDNIVIEPAGSHC